MIELDGISRTFAVGDSQVHALIDIRETVAEGEHVAIMGPSGSGKSTLLNILGCLDRPTSGSFRFDGREVSGLDDDELTQLRRRQIGFVFQFFHLVPRLSALGNVELPLLFAGISAAERRQRARQALDAVGVAQRADHRPDQLSGGERQRVAIARATVTEPRLLLADEPTGNLDTASGRQILELLDRLSQNGLTEIVVTHDPAVAKRADRVVVLVDGRINRRLSGDEIDGPVILEATLAAAGSDAPDERDEPA